AILARLGHLLHQPMERKNYMRAIANAELFLNVDTRGRKLRHFFAQRRQIHHHAVADDSLDARTQNSAGNQLEDELFFADVDRVSRVVAALVARDDSEPLGEEIDHFTLTLVGPLRTKYDDVFHGMWVQTSGTQIPYCSDPGRETNQFR